MDCYEKNNPKSLAFKLSFAEYFSENLFALWFSNCLLEISQKEWIFEKY